MLYSVPARLINERLRIHLYDDRLIVHHAATELMTLKRLRPGADGARVRNIDYRHVIGWLVRKPRALASLAFRDELLPDTNWQAIYQQLRRDLTLDEACKRVVGGLKLAADQDRSGTIGTWWLAALEAGSSPTLIELQDRFNATPQAVPEKQFVVQHPLASYDRLIREACHG